MLQPPSRDTIVHLVQNRRVHELSATHYKYLSYSEAIQSSIEKLEAIKEDSTNAKWRKKMASPAIKSYDFSSGLSKLII